MVLGILCLLLAFDQDGGIRTTIVLFCLAGIALMPLGSYAPVFQVRQAYGKISLLGVAVQALTLLGAFLFHLLGLIPGLFGLLVILREVITALGTRLLGRQQLKETIKPIRQQTPAIRHETDLP